MRHVDTGAVRLAVETWPAGGALDPARTVIGIHGLTANQILTSSYFRLESTRAPDTGTLSDHARRMLKDPVALADQMLAEVAEE